MEYNNAKSKLLLREYGRNVQMLSEYAVSLEDEEKRKNVAAGIVEIMGHLNPSLKQFENYKQKLWDHLVEISGGKLAKDSPFPPAESSVLNAGKPNKVEYPSGRAKHRNYGRNILDLIDKAIAMEDEAKKTELTVIIANYMKLIHRNWHHENVSDEIVKHDVKELSKGLLIVPEDANMNLLASTTRRKPAQKSNNQRKGGRSNNNNNNQRRRNNYR